MKNKTDLQDFSWIEKLLPELGFSHFGISELVTPQSFVHYETWLANGHQADMKYMEAQVAKKRSPDLTWSPAQSAFVFAAPYIPHPEAPNPLKEVRVAQYAQGADYHHWFKARLEKLCLKLKEKYPDESFLPLTDSAPLLERDLAYKAGMGWIGKNTCLIHPQKGSFFLLGEILTSLSLHSKSASVHDFCGTCTRCIEVCPTQALVSERVLDANKCISYWTIESRKIPDENLRKHFGDWLFGCDLCQSICPWNQKIYKDLISTQRIEPNKDKQALEEELRWILSTSGKQIEKKLRSSPLLRAGPFGLRRNALIVIANRQILELIDLVKSYLPHPKLGALARWTLETLTGGRPPGRETRP